MPIRIAYRVGEVLVLVVVSHPLHQSQSLSQSQKRLERRKLLKKSEQLKEQRFGVKMIKFLYAIAKAIPALQQILDKLFGVAKEHTAAARRTAKDDLVDGAIADALASPRMHDDEASEQRASDSASTVSGSSTSSTGVHTRSAQDDQPS